ncbi:MAG: acetolactate synthase small subunit [Candidatus Lambdaproteobacteria bacterium RIFOXYD1_FULL_56_27]|uniref:Acetolactate synthase small subunit n=1 Tax=Candidatus Lambdaproteobacteria bacterium RIFOXYD2_FULL_56_26 TaxID=1817773 RepID=A0A1F6GSW3_9PROT|nr:MAG: acetolactate synthase small subunit [Candidatus Lambdaproteobacteria bacterium RIFOXYC1_FULL_56_13]OGH01276.1 MAG: acetolactate synthase small subunit [Candidatus Lambdaproteobacteria bacterium RIFOXYD2_FULL_56_26]OGH06253.1 MAG: acetolactate synthase small subunit [Candidatus Lambdaproteobacteria bacterium RIFOXYD1_FULL_56_27]
MKSKIEGRHVIALEVEDKPGVLTRISALFSRRGFNVESLTVGHTHQPGVSRFTIVVVGAEAELEQVRKQTQKLINVLKTFHVLDQEEASDLELTQGGAKNVQHAVMRELALVKVHYDKESARQINHIVERFSARMLHWSGEDLVLEFSGTEAKVDAVFEELKQVTVLESVRTGKVAMSIETK